MVALQYRLVFPSVVVLACSILSSLAWAAEPIWAKHATPLDLSCSTHPHSIPSPDHRFLAEALCHGRKGYDPTFSIIVRGDASQTYEAALDEGAHELLWAADSTTFFVDGSTSGYAGFFVTVYQIDS